MANHLSFDSGSLGTDGALVLSATEPTIINFPPEVLNLSHRTDNVYHFSTINIGAEVTLKLRSSILGAVPVIWRATGPVVIEGTLDLNGDDGFGSRSLKLPAIAGAGGYNGGIGAATDTNPQPGRGPGGGGTSLSNSTDQSRGAGAGHFKKGSDSEREFFLESIGGPPYGNDFLIPLLGGSGGGGGNKNNASFNGGGGGGGGGALLIASSVSISVNGSISANGGGGGPGDIDDNTQGLSGGGGSGGAIRLISPLISGTGILTALGGSGIEGSGAGSKGRIRLESFLRDFTFQTDPLAKISVPGIVFPPDNAPAVSIVSIDGVSTPASPTGSFIIPDVTIEEAVSSTTLQLEASGIPLGTQINLKLFPETGLPLSAVSSALIGSVTTSSATAAVTFPHGLTRVFVQATWEP